MCLATFELFNTRMHRFELRYFLLCFLIQCMFPDCGSAIRCWECENADNFTECAASGKLNECNNTQVCSTEVRKANGSTKIWKECKEREACENQRMQNWEITPHNCNNDQDHSNCWCCCDNDSCNMNETCEVISDKCPMPSLHMPHGHVTCSNSNHLGSLCSYQCNETGYHGLPLNKLDRLCLGSGRWSENKPCCVKACPPNVPLDLVAVGQLNSAENLRKRRAGSIEALSNITRSEEYYQSYTVMFNEKVYAVIGPGFTGKFKYQPSENNTANIGAALWYVHDNILSHLHRRSKHSDVIIVTVEKESDDDVTAAVAELKKDGVTIFYVFHESPEHSINMEEARKIASSEKHIIVEDDGDYKKMFDEIFAVACNYPCPNDEEA